MTSIETEIGSTSLFAGLSSRRLRQLVRLVTIRDVAAGESLIDGDEPSRDVLVILNGEVDLIAGREVIARLASGDIVNETALAGPHEQLLQARAVGAVHAAAFGDEELLALLAEEPAIAVRFVRLLATRNVDLAARLVRVPSPTSSA